MDTVYCSHRWLLWSVLIVLLNQCWEVSGSGHECPQGQLMHWHLVHFRPQYITCCFPTRCGVGEHVKPCDINGTQDTCQLCSAYQNQSLRTSSFTMEPCTYWPLDKECKNVANPSHQRDTNYEQTKRCMCNIELGKQFIPPESQFPGAPMDSYCQRRHIPCKPGHEPVVNGGCRPCRDNYFKSVEGFRLCEPKTNCSMLGLHYISFSNATADNNCSEPDPITTPKSYVPDTPVPVYVNQKPPSVVSSQSSPTTTVTTQDTGRFGESQDLGKDDDSFPWPVVGVVLFLVLLVVFIVLIMFWRNRKGKPVWMCATTKNCTDPEKNYAQGSGSPQGAHQVKHLGEGCVIPQHLTDVDKVTNNNINGGVPCGMGYLPNGHPNGSIHHAIFNQTDHGNGDAQPFYVNPLHYRLVPTSRPGILRSANQNVTYGQSQGNVRDRSIDSIGQEKLQVHVDEFEANQDLGENDPLLIQDHLRGVAAPCQIPNQAASVGNSPPVIQANGNPLHLLTYSRPGQANYGPAFVHSGASSPPVQPHGPAVTFAPATGAVTFTRSTSVIASPEGEVDEDEIEARLPRLSQLLTEGENSSVIESDAARDFRADSPGRETTQQLRAPSQRLTHDHYHPAKHGNATNQQPRRQGNNPTQQRPGYLPAVVGPVPQRGSQLNQPDHRIMNLKEQQLAESIHSTFNNPLTDGQQNPNQSTPKTFVHSPEESQQTEVKTRMPPNITSTGASANVKTAKTEQDNVQTTESKHVVDSGRSNNITDRKRQVSGGSSGQNTLEKKHIPGGTNFQNVSERKRVPSGGSNGSGHNTSEKKHAPGGTNFQNVSERKRVPSGGSNSSDQNTLERQRAPSGDQHRPCIKNSSTEDVDTTVKRHPRYNRTVSFEEDENPQLVNKQRGPSTESRQTTKSNNSPEKVTSDHRFQGPLRSISDPEQKNTGQIDSDDEETERKCLSLEYNASNGSSKTSVNSDASGTDSSTGSPCRTALYRRSQSENAPSSTESNHKQPPPRSMSEEKPQKLDRPIAKVKPMPASDNAVNQLPFEVSEETGAAVSQLPIAIVGAHNNAADYNGSSDESDQEDNSEGNTSNTSALEENEGIREDDEEEHSV